MRQRYCKRERDSGQRGEAPEPQQTKDRGQIKAGNLRQRLLKEEERWRVGAQRGARRPRRETGEGEQRAAPPEELREPRAASE